MLLHLCTKYNMNKNYQRNDKHLKKNNTELKYSETKNTKNSMSYICLCKFYKYCIVEKNQLISENIVKILSLQLLCIRLTNISTILKRGQYRSCLLLHSVIRSGYTKDRCKDTFFITCEKNKVNKLRILIHLLDVKNNK